ncbi:uncharacterized protein SCHCODRAFT_02685994 [Schizophyllum commune H4-8]|uniref:uncharacterized protein n=1 Tax=Schizophyllum commune (strain H4-8 / FGSC 9210) TaxID=578458 RepID=UPI0021604B70|nr:uncharacterized protein SCHCODRAFT_02685994 [Schizophyllum commune H4-8]KAI5897106.1 hypothetical protein SCHCODRAFT_02685994 [Schizophyllum commune H4-8]
MASTTARPIPTGNGAHIPTSGTQGTTGSVAGGTPHSSAPQHISGGLAPGTPQQPTGSGGTAAPNAPPGGSNAPPHPARGGGGGYQPPAFQVSGLALPIPQDFDYDAWMRVPPANPSLMPIKLRHNDNRASEAHNAASIRQTLLYQDPITRANIGLTDVGAPLWPLFAYTEEEIDDLAEDAYGTIAREWPNYPDFLQAALKKRKAHAKQADEAKAAIEAAEKDARKLKPVPIKIAPMIFKSTPQAQVTDVDTVPIPDIIISQLACKVPLDDTFFLNKTLRLLADQTNIKTRTHTQHATKDATLIDIPATKLALRLPDEADLNLAQFDEASLNRLRAYIIVSPPEEAVGNETTIAHHLRPHIEFNRSLREREERFHVWRPIERMFLNRIIKEVRIFEQYTRLRRPPPPFLRPTRR